MAGSAANQMEAGDRSDRIATIAVAGAGVIDAYPLVREPAQTLIQRLSDRLAEQIPESDVHSRGGAHLHPGPGEAEILILQRPRMPVDLQCGFPEQERCHGFVNLRLDSAGAEECLAQADQPFVRVDMKPEQIGELAEADGLETCDLHGVFSRCAALSRPPTVLKKTARVIPTGAGQESADAPSGTPAASSATR